MDLSKLIPSSMDDMFVYNAEGGYWQATGSGIFVLSVISTLVWAVLNLAASAVACGSRKLNSKSARCRSFMLSTLHAIIVAGFAGYKIIYGPGDLSYNREIGTITMGYFIVDWTISMKEYISHKDEFLHHSMAIGLTVCTLSMPSLTEFIPNWLVIEASTPFYNGTWYLKKIGLGDSALHHLFTAAFVLSFFLLRVLWLPHATYEVIFLNPDKWHAMGFFKWFLIPVAGLQFYWFALIMAKVVKLMSGKKKGGDKKKQ